MNIIEALLSVQKKLEAVTKAGENNHFKNQKTGEPHKYATIEAVLGEALPKLNEAGILLTQTLDKDDLITTLHYFNKDTKENEFLNSQCTLYFDPAKMQSKVASVTYARRVSLIAFLGLSCEDEDGNGTFNASKETTVKPYGGSNVRTTSQEDL